MLVLLTASEHFISVCPLMRELRRKWFEHGRLHPEEVVKYLNGENREILVGYVSERNI